jgi:hypothetical protein
MEGDTLKDFASVYVDHVGQPRIDRPDRRAASDPCCNNGPRAGDLSP